MESSTILTADVLDILFEGRNKEYGAYDLRRTYNKRLVISITVMLSVILLSFIGFAFGGGKKQLAQEFIIPPDMVLESHKPEEKKEIPVIPPPKQSAPPVQVQTIRVTPPVIVRDDQVTKEEMPPVDEIEHVRIGTETNAGVPDGDLVIAPPGDGAGNVIELPKKEEEDWNKVFQKVEIESDYPGGRVAWQRFLNRNLRFPPVEDVQGTVVVQFIVGKDGSVSNVEAVSGPDELRAEAVRVIKKSGKWTPAIQNGHQVISQKRQPIIFRFENGE
jgi:periplasmic protein TonB